MGSKVRLSKENFNASKIIRRKIRRAISATIVAVIVVVVIVAAVGGYLYYSSSSQPKTLTTLQIGSSTSTTVGGLVAVAEAEGFFAKEGINASITYFQSGAAETNAIASGQIPLGISGATPFLGMVTGGVPVVLIATAYKPTATHFLIVNKNLNVTTPQQLEGLKLGLPFGSDAQYLTYAFLKLYNIPISKVQLVNLQPAQLVTAYKQGQIDGISFLWVPPVRQAIQSVPSTILAQNNESFFYGSTQQLNLTHFGAIFARTDWLKQNQQVAVNFLKAMYMAQQFVNNPSNYNKSISDIANAIGATTSSVAADFQGLVFQISITPSVAEAYQNEINLMYGAGVFKTSVNISNYVDTNLLAQVSSSLVSYQGGYTG
ncbi:MAG: ABC transporter substrate-binding protein [Conexivisphaerales archaeon]